MARKKINPPDKYHIGLIQGRLTPQEKRAIQFFPFENWQKEFFLAKKLGLNDIEFIFDLERYPENPLWKNGGEKKIKEVIKTTGILVDHICVDFFMRLPLSEKNTAKRKRSLLVLKKLLRKAKTVGAKTVEIPILENASVKNSPRDRQRLTTAIKSVLPLAEKLKIKISFESDLPPKELLAFIKNFKSPIVGVVYDTGNSASLGYDCVEEITVLGKYLTSVQIKDRLLGGGTVPLGKGVAHFDAIFKTLQKVGYKNNFVLQVARGPGGKEVETIAKQILFTKKYIKKYLK